MPQKVSVQFSTFDLFFTSVKDTPNDASENEGKAWNTVLDKYRLTGKSRSRFVSRLLRCVILVNDTSKLKLRNLRKPHLRPLLGSLHTILSSDRHNDDISGEIAEMVGFDEIDLVMDMLNERAAVVHEVRHYLTLSQRFQLIMRTKLEGVVDLPLRSEPSTSAGLHATGCACCKIFTFSIAY